ncbi:unnamed protein product [Didymodactylos carnosus]|uniref:Uncharacterized protein n=2 Tax=Didymodactylos carnosus TaxID=1234261 RepID=A0A815W6L6_9BILA|nr:unnamed protein product [Didymodactylos carnosus]CAF4405136.1 unnamed protein product [Didymodactylos carnosus]
MTIDLDKDLVYSVIIYASDMNVTLCQLMLASYYTFLFKQCQQTDVCIGTINANRYRSELQSLIGMFVNTLPLRLKEFDPIQSFSHLLINVKQLCLDTFDLACLSYQEIIRLHRTADSITTTSTWPFIQTMFLFYDFLSFDERNVQLDDETSLSLVQQWNLRKSNELTNLNATHIEFDRPLKPIHEEFYDRANEYSQKLAVVLDEQTLTYSETLYYVQRLATHLIEEYHVKVGDIICQCMERSIEIVLGILSILAAGAIYCPLNPNDCAKRLFSSINEVQAILVLVEPKTMSVFDVSEYYNGVNVHSN